MDTVKKADKYIGVYTKLNTRELTSANSKKITARGKIIHSISDYIVNEKDNIRGCTVAYPVIALAQDAEMSLTEYENFVYSACLQDWKKLGKFMDKISKRFEKGKNIHLIGENVDLKFSIKDKNCIIDKGEENMPGGDSFKPGDVLKTMSGKTIEILNTDAEGRLILADALTYAEKYKPKAVIDMATLTGACVIALGNHATGIMGTDEKLIDAVKKAGEKTGERVWQLPLWEEYDEMIKSDIADVKNIGGRGAGTITAAALLKKFASDYSWAHLDIAGTAWTDKPKPYVPKGAVGVGVRLLVQYLKTLS